MALTNDMMERLHRELTVSYITKPELLEIQKKCHAEYLEDKKKYGNEQSGTYLGMKWNTYRVNMHWCGHFEPCVKLTQEQYDHIETLSHHELTATDAFDCAHYDDYFLGTGVNKNTQYRTFTYVRDILYKIIEYIDSETRKETESKEIQEPQPKSEESKEIEVPNSSQSEIDDDNWGTHPTEGCDFCNEPYNQGKFGRPCPTHQSQKFGAYLKMQFDSDEKYEKVQIELMCITGEKIRKYFKELMDMHGAPLPEEQQKKYYDYCNKLRQEDEETLIKQFNIKSENDEC